MTKQKLCSRSQPKSCFLGNCLTGTRDSHAIYVQLTSEKLDFAFQSGTHSSWNMVMSVCDGALPNQCLTLENETTALSS